MKTGLKILVLAAVLLGSSFSQASLGTIAPSNQLFDFSESAVDFSVMDPIQRKGLYVQFFSAPIVPGLFVVNSPSCEKISPKDPKAVRKQLQHESTLSYWNKPREKTRESELALAEQACSLQVNESTFFSLLKGSTSSTSDLENLKFLQVARDLIVEYLVDAFSRSSLDRLNAEKISAIRSQITWQVEKFVLDYAGSHDVEDIYVGFDSLLLRIHQRVDTMRHNAGEKRRNLRFSHSAGSS